MPAGPTAPVEVSFVVPANDEEAYLPETLESIRAQRTDRTCEVVVDGGSTDRTVPVARGYDARVLVQSDGGIGAGRHLGASEARGEWLAFVDPDTVLSERYLETMLAYVETEGLAAASSRCRIAGPRRALVMQWVINHVFSRLGRPVLPGFNVFVGRAAYEAAGGFPDVPNEDTAFSRRLGRCHPTGYCPDVLVESSGRRVESSGLTGTLSHYLRLDAGRLAAER